MKIEELRKLSVEELRKELDREQEALFKLRMQQSSDQSPKSHLFGQSRRQIARINTVIQQIQRAQA